MYSDVGADVGEGEGEVAGVGTHPATTTIAERKRGERMMNRDINSFYGVERHTPTLTKS
jgi:hypothetical protein